MLRGAHLAVGPDAETLLRAREREHEGRTRRLHGPVGRLGGLRRPDDAEQRSPRRTSCRSPRAGSWRDRSPGNGRARRSWRSPPLAAYAVAGARVTQLAVARRLQCVAAAGHRVHVLGYVRVRTQLGGLGRHQLRVGLGALLAHRVGMGERLRGCGRVLGLVGERRPGDGVLPILRRLSVELLGPRDVRGKGCHRHGEGGDRHGDRPEVSVPPQAAHGTPRLLAGHNDRSVAEVTTGWQCFVPRLDQIQRRTRCLYSTYSWPNFRSR